jgi:uncharacterized protein involved in exopolysaccharide biosynthesis
MGTPTRERLQQLESRREGIRALCERELTEIRDSGRETLNEAETRRIAAMREDLSDLDDTIREYREDLGGNRKLLDQLGTPLLLAVKPVYRAR